MSNSIKLSVIIPTYNREKLLRRCLRSVVPNMTKDIEIIVVSSNISIDMLTPEMAHLNVGKLKRKWKNYYKKSVKLEV